ncbi:glycosyltransferase [Bacteroides fragilis]|uniref:glycosyltransferase n=1 Tax=Bacteroides fragilis TaxID=817 RepID=UPI0022AAC4BD|nr:glycosyltransferase [Bacteroides fragilis]MCZ2684784.1 glycosyltransferase [Bacteroides fragilis]
MNIAPLVSVIMPSYNSKKYIKKAIDSVLEQTYSNFELIIVDGNSTDGTLDILDEYKKQDRRIKVIQDEGRGIGAALQLGCQIASGKFIARMDSDDIAINTRFEKQLKIFHSIPNLILVASPVIYINEDDSIVGYSFPYTNKRIIQEKVYLIAHPTVMMKKDAYVKAGGYQPLLRAEDYFLWNRMRLMGEFYIFKEPLIKYRLLQDSLSHTLDDNFNKKLGSKLESYFIKPIISEIDIIEINDFISTNLPKNRIISHMSSKRKIRLFSFLKIIFKFLPLNIFVVKFVISIKNVFGFLYVK